MYVVTKQGKKLLVDTSSIDFENDYVPFQETVGLYSDATVLKKTWILQLQVKTHWHEPLDYPTNELQFVKELQYDHYPTKEEILWAMSKYGISRYGIATIFEGYELDMESE